MSPLARYAAGTVYSCAWVAFTFQLAASYTALHEFRTHIHATTGGAGFSQSC